MKLASRNDIEEILKTYNNFQECIIEAINCQHYATIWEITFNYIWTFDGDIRENLDEPELVTVRFHLVQRFHFNGELNYAMVQEPDSLNWGLNEIAFMKLEDNDDDLKPYESLPVPFHHIVVYWEDDRRIDIVFSELEI